MFVFRRYNLVTEDELSQIKCRRRRRQKKKAKRRREVRGLLVVRRLCRHLQKKGYDGAP
jgi:hypothetical protein